MNDEITFFNYKNVDGKIEKSVEQRPLTDEEKRQPYVAKTIQLAEDNLGSIAAGVKLERDGEIEVEDADLLDRLGDRPLGNIGKDEIDEPDK